MGGDPANQAPRRAAQAVAALTAAPLLVPLFAPLILAHVAISLLVLSPRQGETVQPDTGIVVLAQRTLGGVDHTVFTARLDGRPLGEPVDIPVGDRVTIPMRGLAPGHHRLEIDYRPDLDEPTRSATVDFEVAGAGSPRGTFPGSGPARLAVLALLVLLTGGGLLLGRRARSSRRPRMPAGS
jgi:hypothetical protein